MTDDREEFRRLHPHWVSPWRHAPEKVQPQNPETPPAKSTFSRRAIVMGFAIAVGIACLPVKQTTSSDLKQKADPVDARIAANNAVFVCAAQIIDDNSDGYKDGQWNAVTAYLTVPLAQKDGLIDNFSNGLKRTGDTPYAIDMVDRNYFAQIDSLAGTAIFETSIDEPLPPNRISRVGVNVNERHPTQPVQQIVSVLIRLPAEDVPGKNPNAAQTEFSFALDADNGTVLDVAQGVSPSRQALASDIGGKFEVCRERQRMLRPAQITYSLQPGGLAND